MDSGAQQDPSASDVRMDTGAQQDAPDTGAPTSGAGTVEDAGTGDKSADTDKGKAPEVPKVTPATPEQPAPKTPTTEKTSVPAKTAVPAKTSVPAKSGTIKMKQIIKIGTHSAATASAKPAPSSSALALHFGKAAARPSFFETPELEGRISLLTKSDKSLGSLKEYCVKWNDANCMDTASSKKKKLAEGSATGNLADILAAKPIAIASELLSIQQRLHLLADATNVSLFYIYISPVPKNVGCPGYGHPGFSNTFCT
jgi:hypothetical protein